MENLFLKILNMSLTGALVILVVLLARLLLRKAPKVFSYALWAVVLFRLLCPVRIYSGWSWIPAVQKAPADNGQTMVVVHTQHHALSGPVGAVNDYFMEHPIPVRYTSPEGVYVPELGAFPWNDHVPGWAAAAAGVWLAGAALLLGYSLISLLALRRRLVGSVPLEGEKDVRLADHIPSPFVLGVFRPRIYLPSGLPEGERDYILLHERTHIRRFDHVFRALAWLAVAVHWFDPLVWLAFHLAGKDMEMSCDEAVLRKMGRDVRADYSSSLLRLSTGKRLPAGPLAFGDGDPKSRIKNVLSYKKPAFWVIVTALIGVVCAVLALATDPGSFIGGPKPDDGLSCAFNEAHTAVVITGHEKERAEWFFSEKVQSVLCVTGVTVGGDWEDPVCYAFWSSEDRNAVKMELIRAPVVLDYTILVSGPERVIIERRLSGTENPELLLSDEEAAELATRFADYLRRAEEWYERERSTLPLPELEANLKLYPYSDVIRIEGCVGDFSLGWGTVWDPPSKEYPRGNLAMYYPPFDNGIVGSVRAWWTDESRTAVAMSTRPMVYVSSQMPSGYWTFTVTLSETGGTVSGMTPHVLGEGVLGNVRMLPESVPDREAVKLARIVAKLLTAAEDYYNNSAPAQALPESDVWMEAVPGTVAPTGLTYLICNETGRELIYGESFTLQVEEGGAWRDLDVDRDRLAFIDIGYTIDGKTLHSDSRWVDWSYLYGELSPGHYRMVKKAHLGSEREPVTLSAEFEIGA